VKYTEGSLDYGHRYNSAGLVEWFPSETSEVDLSGKTIVKALILWSLQSFRVCMSGVNLLHIFL